MNRALMAAVLVVAAASAQAAQMTSHMINVIDRGASGLSVTTEFPTAQEILQTADPSEYAIVYDDQDRSVPAVVKWIAVPEGCIPELMVTGQEAHQFDGSDVTGEKLSPEELASRNLWPHQAATLGRVEVVRGIPVAPLSIYKLQLGENDAGVENDQVDIDVRFVRSLEAPAVQEFHEQPFTRTARFVRGMLLNKPTRDDPIPDQAPYIDHILILYNAGMVQAQGIAWVDTLANWKRQMGYKVTTRGIQIGGGGMTALEIRQMIRNQYYFGVNDPIDHLIIMGSDTSNQPTEFPTCEGPESLRGDHGYSLMDIQRGENDVGLIGDMVPDITVGRFDVVSYTQLQGAVKRSIYYERTPYTERGYEWFDNALYTAENIQADGGQFVPSMRHLGKWIVKKLREDDYNPVWELYTGSSIDSIGYVQRRTAELLEDEGLAVAISRGWLGGAADPDRRIVAITGRRNPFVMAITCLSYTPQKYFFRETRGATLNGPVASFAIWGLTHSKTNNGLMGGMIRGMRYFGETQPGYIMNFSKWQLWSDYQYDATVNLEKLTLLYLYRLMGDPTVDIYNGIPDSLVATNFETVPSGATGFNVVVTADDRPVENATVCLSHPNGLHLVVSTGADGSAHFNFDEGALTAGNMTMTITRHNALPSIKTITVADAGQNASAVVTNVNLADDDGLYANGDTVGVTVTYTNRGGANLNNATLVLSSNQPRWVTFLSNNIAVNSIASHNTRDVTFRIALDPSTPFGTRVVVRMALSSGAFHFDDAFKFTTSGPDLNVASVGAADQFGRNRVTRFAPVLRNLGNDTSIALSATLRCLENQLVTITDSMASYGPAAPDNDAQVTGDFAISTSVLLVPGTELHFKILLQSADQRYVYFDTLDCTVKAGVRSESDPSGPDSYGYYCFDSFDDSWEKHPSYAWREINPARRGEIIGHEANMPDYRVDLDTNNVLDLPFTFKFYGREFNQITLNSNGWIAFGAEQAEFLDFRNWQLPGIQGPDAMLAVFWDDLFERVRDGNGIFYYYKEDEHIFIIEWSGQEIVGDIGGGRQEFQIILSDPAFHPTRSGDGDIKCQYRQIVADGGTGTDNRYSTIGIKNIDGSDGITYNYWNTPFEGARLIQNEMALLYTTDLELLTGSARGHVTRFEDNNVPLEGVRITTASGLIATSDVNGDFSFAQLPTGATAFMFQKLGFNNESVVVNIVEGQEAHVAAGLKHPAIVPPANSVRQDLQPGENHNTQKIDISNTGNGQLDYRLTVRDPDGRAPSYSQLLSINGMSIDRIGRNTLLRGVEFVGSEMYVSVGGNSNEPNDNWIVVLNRQGGEIRRFRQNSTTGFGFGDLAWDGTYLYGGEDNDIDTVDTVTVFDTFGNVARKIAVPFNANSEEGGLPQPYALTYYPPHNSLLMATTGTPIFEMSLDGDSLSVIPLGFINLETDIQGLAYNPGDIDGMPIYAIMKSIYDSRKMWLAKTDGDKSMIVRQLAQNQTEDAYGLGVGFDWQQGRTVLATVANRSNDTDTLRVFDLGPDTRSISIDRDWQSVAPGGTGHFDLNFTSKGIAIGTYEYSLMLFHNASLDSVKIPVMFKVDPEAGIDVSVGNPSTFNLEEAFPNPFNSTTVISFTLPRTMNTRLAIYDLNGREVERLLDGRTMAGRQTILLNADNYAAGLYFARLDGEDKSIVRRLVLIK